MAEAGDRTAGERRDWRHGGWRYNLRAVRGQIKRYPAPRFLVKPRRFRRPGTANRRCHGRLVRIFPQIPAVAAGLRGHPGDARLLRAAPLPADGQLDGRPGSPGGVLDGRRIAGKPARADGGDAFAGESLPHGGRCRRRSKSGARAAAIAPGGGGGHGAHAPACEGGPRGGHRRQRQDGQRVSRAVQRQSRPPGAVRRAPRGAAGRPGGDDTAGSLRRAAHRAGGPQHAPTARLGLPRRSARLAVGLFPPPRPAGDGGGGARGGGELRRQGAGAFGAAAPRPLREVQGRPAAGPQRRPRVSRAAPDPIRIPAGPVGRV